MRMNKNYIILTLSGRQILLRISRVHGLVGGASEGQEIKVEFHEPEAIG